MVALMDLTVVLFSDPMLLFEITGDIFVAMSVWLRTKVRRNGFFLVQSPGSNH